MKYMSKIYNSKWEQLTHCTFYLYMNIHTNVLFVITNNIPKVLDILRTELSYLNKIKNKFEHYK